MNLHPVPTVEGFEYLHANDQQYRVCDESQFETEAHKLIDGLAALRTSKALQAFTQVHIQVIAGTEQRRQDLMKMVQPKVSPHAKITASAEVFPFNFHSYRFRGRTGLMVVVDRDIAEKYFNGFDRSSATNHQITLNLTLSTMCHLMDKSYSEFYFIV